MKMNYNLAVRLSISLLTSLAGCQNQVDESAIDAALIIDQVEAKVSEFHKADTSLNADMMVDLLWDEFTMLADGNYIQYEDVKLNSKAFMASLETFHTEWNDLRIVPISSSHAISSFIFTDSLVSKDGTTTQSRGPNTFVWEKRNGEWKVIYGDADHYPIKEEM